MPTPARDSARNDAPGPPNDPAVGQPLRDLLQRQLVASGGGDELAFAQLYEGLAPRVYGLVLRVLKDVHQAGEVTQEVFLELWETSNRFDPSRGSARSWVMTVAHRRAVERVRSTQAGPRGDLRDASRETAVDGTAAAAQTSAEASTLRSALATLTPLQRQALDLAYLGGHTHSEVSRLLQLPLGAAKTRIRDGLIQLRDVLVPLEPDPAQ